MIHQFLTLIIFLFLSTTFAKAQIGDPFGASQGPSFPQLGMTNDLNSLQVLATPLTGEPFALSRTNKSSMHLASDNPQSLQDVFNPLFVIKDHLQDLEALRSGQVKKNIWSSHLFPTAKGGIAYRYQIYGEKPLSWLELSTLHQKTSSQDLIDQKLQDLLSPMEKYELLIGKKDFGLSKAEWIKGLAYFERFSEVPLWIGLCHGSAPASIQDMRPMNTITVTSIDHKDIRFSPTDLKALIAFSWAQSAGPSAIMGSRCGKHLQPHIRPSLNCRDTNPASFHLALMNLVGLQEKALIVDSSAGPEVWNKVLKNYSYSFFRPGTRNLNTNLRSSLIDLASFHNDPYRLYRSPNATHLIGVSMLVTYSKETEIASVDRQLVQEEESVRYWYDLEISNEGKIIGGEWHQQIHPDFFWVVAEDYRPRTIFDYVIQGKLDDYTGSSPLSLLIRSEALKAAEQGEILYEIIHRLLRLSQ